MNSVTGLLGVLALILAIATLFIATILGKKRAIEEAGYRPVETPDQGIELVTRRLFDQVPGEVHARDERNGQSWLVRVNTVSGDLGCTMVVYPFARNDWPEVAMIRGATKAPEMLRTLAGGFISLLDAVPKTDVAALAGSGWEAYRERGRKVPKPLADWMYKLTRLSGARQLVGIAVCGPYLVAWTDSDRINALLKVATKLPASLRDAST